MAYRDKESEREYQRNHYLANKDLYKERAKKSRVALKDRNREYVRSIKETNPCKDCGKFYHYSQMDFDHVDDNKINSVARLTNASLSIERIKSEIEKCELVCSNCHRYRTWQRLQS